MKTIVIVQARMTSTRLPGKVMLPLGNKTVLGQVLSRCWKIKGIDDVCCAIPEGKDHDIIEIEAMKYKASIYRGSEFDVLDRYYQAGKFHQADIMMRITSDCPLIDPDVCSLVLNKHLEGASEYTCNNMPPTWPHGFDCEVFGIDALGLCHREAQTHEEREHVTPWMRSNLKCYNVLNESGNFYSERLTLDTSEDYQKIYEVYNQIRKIPYINIYD